MQKLIIGALVGAFLVFIWQFLSWSKLGIHTSQMKYLDTQQEVLDCLEGKLDAGQYYIPQPAPGSSSADSQAYAMEHLGKPWAQINYNPSLTMTMGMNMARGFLVDFIALLLLCWLLMKIPNLGMQNTVMAAIAVGLIGYLTGKYTEGIWFELNTIPDLIDTLVQWLLAGAWLGWWLNRD